MLKSQSFFTSSSKIRVIIFELWKGEYSVSDLSSCQWRLCCIMPVCAYTETRACETNTIYLQDAFTKSEKRKAKIVSRTKLLQKSKLDPCNLHESYLTHLSTTFYSELQELIAFQSLIPKLATINPSSCCTHALMTLSCEKHPKNIDLILPRVKNSEYIEKA